MTFLEAIDQHQPDILIGATGTPATFTEEIIGRMAKIKEHPGIFALSNPTTRAECTAEQAYRWTNGTAIFASGSPFDPVQCNGRTFEPGQGNNSYIFPGVGLGMIACEALKIPEEVFLASARALADLGQRTGSCQGRDLSSPGRYSPGVTKNRRGGI